MTAPKNTPQDEANAKEFVRLEMKTNSGEDPFTANGWWADFSTNELAELLMKSFLAGRLGYVPNQTVVAIAEEAKKEERERLYIKLGSRLSRFAHQEVADIFHPPEAE